MSLEAIGVELLEADVAQPSSIGTGVDLNVQAAWSSISARG